MNSTLADECFRVHVAMPALSREVSSTLVYLLLGVYEIAEISLTSFIRPRQQARSNLSIAALSSSVS